MVLSPCGLRLATKCSERLKHTEFHSETGEGIISSWPPQPPDRGKQNFRKHHLFQALFILEMFSRVKKDQDWFLWFLITWHPTVGWLLAMSTEMITGVKWPDRYLWANFSCVSFCVCGKKWCHLPLSSVTWRMVHWTAITLSEFYFCFNKAKMA